MSNTIDFEDSGAPRHERPEQILVAHYDGPAVLVEAGGAGGCKSIGNDHFVAITSKFDVSETCDVSGTCDVSETCDVDKELLNWVQKVHASGCVETACVSFSGESGTSHYQTTFVPRVLGKWVLCLLHDQTLEHNLREALIESRQRFKDLVEVSSDFSWEVDADGYFQFVSRTGALGYAPEALVGKRPEDLVIDAQEFDPVPFLSTETVENIELWMRRSDGDVSCVQVSAVPFFEEDGQYLGIRGVCRDVTLERERASALAQAHQRELVLSYIVNSIRDEINPENMLEAAAAATARALGANGCSVLRKLDQENALEPEQGTPGGYVMAAQYGDKSPPLIDAKVLSFAQGERLIREEQVDGVNILAGPCVHAAC